jgi:aspartyl-tRNA(Asn)/glutamyl-tRNA(Gln) amidotransferase subunit A
MMQLYDRTIHELRDMLARGETTSRKITESVLDRIKTVDGQVRAYLTLVGDEALASADKADEERRSASPRAPVHGIPVAIKDNMCTEGIRTTCASKILERFVPPYDASVVARLKSDGCVIPGKVNMDEFAMGSSTENSGYFITRNPWDLERIPGGSSGGSAAAVAAGECIAALGSDTGGSIRQPAACCGVVGLKPTYGRVSRYGLVAFASSLDQIGPITKDVTDAAILMNIIAGHDPKDSTSAAVPVPDYTKSLVKDVKGMKVGIPREYFIEGMDPEVDRAVRDAIRVLEGLGASVVDVSLPHTGYAVATYYILATSEASSNLARYDGVKYGFRAQGAKDLLDLYRKSRNQGFGHEVKRRIMLGTYALSAGYYEAYYKKGQQVRTLIKRDFDEAFQRVDVIATPTAPTAAFKIGEKSADPLQMYLSDIFTISVNLAGIPGISIPCGFTRTSLPIGLQLLGRHFDEESILRAAHAYEQSTEWHRKRAAL